MLTHTHQERKKDKLTESSNISCTTTRGRLREVNQMEIERSREPIAIQQNWTDFFLESILFKILGLKR